MKFLRLLSIVVTLLFLSTSTIVGLDAAPKVGGSCKKSGKIQIVQGKKYICAKSGLELKWKRVKKVSKEISRPSNSVKENLVHPVPEQAKYVQTLVNQFLTKLPNEVSQEKIQIIIEPQIRDSRFTKDTVSGVSLGLRILAALGQLPPQPQDIVIMLNPKWAQNFINQTDGCYDGFCQVKGVDGNTLEYAKGVTYVDLDLWQNRLGLDVASDKYKSPFQEFMFKANIVHEMGHWGQREIQRRDNTPSNIFVHPSWMREGAADLLKIIFWTVYSGKSYLEAREEFLSLYPDDCLGIDFAELGIPGATGPEQNGCEYINGLLMVEYLIWKSQDFYSWTKVYDSPMGKGMSRGLSIYGIDLLSFEQEIDRYTFEQACLRISCPKEIPKPAKYLEQDWFDEASNPQPIESLIPGPKILSGKLTADRFEIAVQQETNRDLKAFSKYGEELDFQSGWLIGIKRGLEDVTSVYVSTEDRKSQVRSNATEVKLNFRTGAWEVIATG